MGTGKHNLIICLYEISGKEMLKGKHCEIGKGANFQIHSTTYTLSGHDFNQWGDANTHLLIYPYEAFEKETMKRK